MKQISERVSTGGLTGQGFGNLLGRPRLAALPLVLREAVQNSWDARVRRGSRSLRFSVRVRLLTTEEEKAFRRIFDQSDSLEPPRDNTLAKQLKEKRPIRVLELADFGTVGLSGTTRPDLPSHGVESRFVNFFFDIGRSHEESGDGGTYGFGRSSLYTAGQCRLIVVDSLSQEGDGTERRLFACRIGRSFEVASGWDKGRYSGRHYWGREKSNVAQPLLGRAAAEIADDLGMPKRTSGAHTGTTILIPWPVDGFDDGALIVRTLLRHLWPKMVPVEGQPTIIFDVQIDDRRYPVGNPADMDEYRLFVRALKNARTRKEGPLVRAITTLRPRHVTGYLGLSEGTLRSPLVDTRGDDDDESEESHSVLNQIALMRPSELVVRYLSVPGSEHARTNWAGVFICEDVPFVRTAFALAEPPAHDDWIADRLVERHQKYIVRKTVQTLLPEAVRAELGFGVGFDGDDPAGPSLAATSQRFSSVFLAGDGQGAARTTNGHSAGGTGNSAGGNTRTPVRIVSVEPVGLELRRGVRIAVFRVSLRGRKGSTGVIRAMPRIHAEGTLESPPEGLKGPNVVGWRGAAGEGNQCRVKLENANLEVDAFVAINDEYGVTLDCYVEDE